MAIEEKFDITFISALARREKQIQQTYRPYIGVHKWFARRPGTLFRALLLSEFSDDDLSQIYFAGNSFPNKLIADPFMGGGTPVIEANRLGMRVIGTDINPMSYWVVRQSLADTDIESFKYEAEKVIADVEFDIGEIYSTRCNECGEKAKVKYFLWVKQHNCSECGKENDLFPGYLVATNDRHRAFVWYCPTCRQLAEINRPPDTTSKVACPNCKKPLPIKSSVQRGKYQCETCGAINNYPDSNTVPKHRLFAIEYHCLNCRGQHKGRYFKVPDVDDIKKLNLAKISFQTGSDTIIPTDEIPEGDETSRLHRWGYRYYKDLFNERQLLGLRTLASRIIKVSEPEIKKGLATVFSDVLRYQNMLCRYDTYALKCQDIFSVHGFPVGLIQCENNLLGIPGIGSGGFRHFVEKYIRAKEYCNAPFEIQVNGTKRKKIFTTGERIMAQLKDEPTKLKPKEAYIAALDSNTLEIEPGTLDGVFTDPPYFNNVQYAELMDFCYVWLKQIVGNDEPYFRTLSTRNPRELTGNTTQARGLKEFTEGLSTVFQRMATGLKKGAPLVFTYHHNHPKAYVPLIVSILDAKLWCTSTLACPAEMSASMHINGTGSSTVDSIFVCRKEVKKRSPRQFPNCLEADVQAIRKAGVKVTMGDIICMSLGHLSRIAIENLYENWNKTLTLEKRLELAKKELNFLIDKHPLKQIENKLLKDISN